MEDVPVNPFPVARPISAAAEANMKTVQGTTPDSKPKRASNILKSQSTLISDNQGKETPTRKPKKTIEPAQTRSS